MAKLFDEITLGGVTIKNRLVMAPMGTVHADDGGISDLQKDYLVERAKGGFGLIYPSAHTVSDKYEHPNSSGNHLTCHNHEKRLVQLAEEIHQYGAKLAIQLTPGYGRVNVGLPGTVTTHVSASAVPVFYYPDHLCRPLTVDEIHELVQAAGNAARMAKNAGVDILEVHSYGGYLLDQFISKCWNHRDDEYGGSLENRLRFTMEVRDAIKEACGPDFPVSIKFTPQHCFPGGRTLDDEGIEIVKILEKSGFAYIHLDNGAYECWNQAIPSAYEKPGCQLYVAERLRKEGVKIPFLVQGKLNYPALAENVVESGTADLVAMGHQSLADPYWPRKVKQGRLDDIVYCTGCNECLNASEGLKRFSCAVNPRTAMEREYTLKPAKESRKILVVGGGPGGMYAAALAADQGHDVTLWEKSEKLGGLLNAAGAPDFKVDMHSYCQHLIAQVYKKNIKVRLFQEATPENIDAFAPDAVILASGAKTAVPPIKGIDGENVVTAYDLLANKHPVGKKVVVLGGGHVGCEAALYLDDQGKEVAIVEMLDALLQTASLAHNSALGLKAKLEASSIKPHTGVRVTEILPDRVKISGKDGEYEIFCDNVILASGFRPDHTLGDALKEKPYKLFCIGDYIKPAKVYQAVHGGFHTIRLLDDLMEN